MATIVATQEPTPPPRPATIAISDSLWVRCRMPAARRWSFVTRHPDGTLGTITVTWSISGRWRRSPEAADPRWWAVTLGPFTLAARHEG